jgi:NRAMP (natural resistance-associated macrophage protein)-like metal ion transporter
MNKDPSRHRGIDYFSRVFSTRSETMRQMKEYLRRRFRKFWKALGPGFVTGASDDDPSGIATYSQAGAAFGLGMLWTALVTFPLMAAIQGMCARIGIVTFNGLTHTLKKNYSKGLLFVMIGISLPAIILNIAADIAGMGAVAHMLVPAVSANLFAFILVVFLILCLVYFPYRRIASVLKWLCLILLVYAIVPFMVKGLGMEVLKASFIPHIQFTKKYLAILVGILGTTISPYLFFWQASMEKEDRMSQKKTALLGKEDLSDMRFDVNVGMFFSNLVMYFIILTTGTVLFRAEVTNISTVQDAALALKPLAGKFTYLLFAIGVIGTGFLAIPVLAGSASYILSEALGWKEGLDKKWHEAKGFYVVLAVSIIIGFAINISGIDPIKALIFTAIAYGVTAPVLIAMILHICNNKAIMGEHTNGWISNVLGVFAFLLMTFAAVALFFTM